MSPLEFKHYKDYLIEIVNKSEERGIKGNLAKAAGCQRSFFSQVLNSHVQLTPDHSLGISNYLRHTGFEAEYFYCLIGEARAATQVLSRFYQNKMKKIKKDSEVLTKRFKATPSDEKIAEYYSTWKFAAIHILCTIPQYQSVKSISEKLNLNYRETEMLLNKLKNMKLIKNYKNRWTCTQNEIHLPKSHFMTFINHKNWREKNIDKASSNTENSINYTATYSMSLKDFERLKQLCLEFIDAGRKIVAPSEEEELVSFAIDCVLFN